MGKSEERLAAQVGACQKAILHALIGYEIPTIMAALTTVAGAFVGQQARTPAEARMLVKQMARGMTMLAEDSARSNTGVH